MNKIRLAIIALVALLTGCFPTTIAPIGSTRTPTPAPGRGASIAEARATSIYADAAVNAANAQATAEQADRDLRVTQTAVAVAEVTRAAIADRVEGTKAAVQATLDRATVLEAESKVTIAAVQRDASIAEYKNAQADLNLKQLEVVSSTHAVTTTIGLREMEYRREADRSSNVMYAAADWLYYIAPRCMIGVALPLVLLYLLIRVGRTIARWFERRFEINGVTYILTPDGPTPLLLPPGDDPQDPELETGNTETLGNTGNTVGNTESKPGNTDSGSVSNSDEWLPTYNQGHPANVLRMTPEERSELQVARHEAIGLLSKCVDYYKANPPDIGQIPRYNLLGMHAEDRGYIVDNLEYSGCVSKRPNKPTMVVPEIGTCANLMRLIVSNQKRVYPVGYHERRQARFDQAVMALPGMAR